MRLFLWKSSLEQFHLQPLTGTGSGTSLQFLRQFRAPNIQNDPMHAHDDYLELLAEYGIVGAVLCGIFLFVHLGHGLLGLRRIVLEQVRPGTTGLSHDLALVVGTLSAIAALLFHSLLDFNVHIPANALLAALLLALLASPQSALPFEAASPASSSSGWPWLRWLVAAGAVVLMVLSVRFWPGEIFAEKARVALRDDRNADALDFARRGLQWEQRNPSLYGYLGEAQHFLTLNAADPASARQLQEDAVASYAAGLKLFPQNTGLLLKQAQTLDLAGRFSEAEADFQLLFRYDPLFGNVYAYYGLHWQLQRRMKTAERCFHLAAELGEKEISPRALENLERMKNDPITSSLMSVFPDIDLDLPAARVLPKP
jgi:tetratricopeptide (TPR) repeat protein